LLALDAQVGTSKRPREESSVADDSGTVDHATIPVRSQSHLFLAFPPVQKELEVILALLLNPLLMLRM